jgi:hypothetical protein
MIASLDQGFSSPPPFGSLRPTTVLDGCFAAWLFLDTTTCNGAAHFTAGFFRRHGDAPDGKNEKVAAPDDEPELSCRNCG